MKKLGIGVSSALRFVNHPERVLNFDKWRDIYSVGEVAKGWRCEYIQFHAKNHR